MLRRRIARGQPIRYFVDDKVEAYIQHHGLYSHDAS
jgi:nicotinic acid mononucleotide adenylyltransferase